MHAVPVPPRVNPPQRTDTRHQPPKQRLERVRAAIKPDVVVCTIIRGFWGYHNLPESTGRPNAKQIMHEVARQTGITVSEMKSIRRQRHLVDARHLAMWRIKNECPHLSYPQIGELFGGRDHTTVLHACRRMDGIMARKDVFGPDASRAGE